MPLEGVGLCFGAPGFVFPDFQEAFAYLPVTALLPSASMCTGGGCNAAAPPEHGFACWFVCRRVVDVLVGGEG